MKHKVNTIYDDQIYEGVDSLRRAFFTAACADDVDGVCQALDGGVDLYAPSAVGDVMTHAIRGGSDDVVDALLRRGFDPERVDPKYQQSPLMTAVQFNRLSIADALIRHGANPNAPGVYSDPLSFAFGGNKPEMVRLLVAAGADTTQVRPKAAKAMNYPDHSDHRHSLPVLVPMLEEEDKRRAIDGLQTAARDGTTETMQVRKPLRLKRR